ncbi:MAG TPA: S8 family serine peptidase [Steroidobacteraceae bacterium]|nr:S8 family serine peptidase [Steroidobacteraceae bacterium]
MAVLATLVALQAHAVLAEEFNPVAREPSTREAPASLDVIVKLRSDTPASATSKASTISDRSALLAKRTGVDIQLQRQIANRMLAGHVDLAGASRDQALERLRQDPEVEYVALDRRRYGHATNPNDTLFGGQWYLQATEVSAVNAINAWDEGQGSNGVVVAVLDTGVLYDHPDLGRGDHGGKLLPGFDFVSGIDQANDNDGRDANPSDPGDWVLDSDRSNPAFFTCEVANSSWHGTRVAGMIGARTNNTLGVAGLSWNSFILPVRVLGKCGGKDSDIISGMRWAAGLHVDGVADNPTPARILNLSLGATSPCEPSYLDVIQELTARKVLVVISAGNEGTVVSSPANCPGVAAIASIRHAGSKVGFSNLGPQVTIAAPGGNCVNINGGPCLFSLTTTSNNGTREPSANIFTDQTNFNLGTSFSAPIVSGIAALMLSRNNNLSTGQMLARLREGARPFPTVVSDAPNILTCHIPIDTNDIQIEQCLCTTAVCGAGMVDATNSVLAAARPIAAISRPASVSPGQNVNLNASASAAACGRSVATFAWTVVSPTVNPPAVMGADTATASVLAPTSGSITLRVTVTDDQGRVDAAEVVVEPNRTTSAAPSSAGVAACPTPVTSGVTPGTPPPPPPPPSGSGGGGSRGGGGGGSLEFVTLTLLGALLWRRRAPLKNARICRCN